MYIDTCSLKDYGKVIKFLLRNSVKITIGNKMKMVISAEVSADQVEVMKKEIDFETAVLIGQIPFY